MALPSSPDSQVVSTVTPHLHHRHNTRDVILPACRRASRFTMVLGPWRTAETSPRIFAYQYSQARTRLIGLRRRGIRAPPDQTFALSEHGLGLGHVGPTARGMVDLQHCHFYIWTWQYVAKRVGKAPF
jgi:hypothetical protein